MTTRDHKYLGEIIRECERAAGEHRGKWRIQTYHGRTGMPYSDDCCPHFHSLAEARAAIRDYAIVVA